MAPQRGRCPFAQWRPSRNFGYPQGRHDQNRPQVIVDHVLEGYKSFTDADRFHSLGNSATFVVGRDGSISQHVNLFDAHWANGIVNRPDMSHPFIARMAALKTAHSPLDAGEGWLRDGVNVLNSHSVAVEHEGFTGQEWTAPMLAADISLKLWINEELLRCGHPAIPASEEGLIGHHVIDNVNRANCPGPTWPRRSLIAAMEDQMIPHFRDSTKTGWASGQPFADATYTMQLRPDFDLPEQARFALLEVEAYGPGRVRLLHGGLDERCATAGRARNGISHLRVAISPQGTCNLIVEGGGLDHLHLRCLAYFLG
ncbi:MAG: N-acetylmuramoyl-L-alanine amidase [Dehalococcoidia bacterium]